MNDHFLLDISKDIYNGFNAVTILLCMVFSCVGMCLIIIEQRIKTNTKKLEDEIEYLIKLNQKDK